MTDFDVKFLIAVLVLAVTLVAGFWPFKKRKSGIGKHDFAIGEALASGVFLGAGLLHLLPDAADGFSAQHISYPWVFFLCAITFLVLLSLEHLGREFYQARNCNNQKHQHLPSSSWHDPT